MFNKIVILCLIFFGIFFILGNALLFAQQEIKYKYFITLLNEDKIKQISITDELIKGIYLENGQKILFTTTYPDNISLSELLDVIHEKEIAVVPLKNQYVFSKGALMHNFVFFIPSFLIVTILIVILILNILIYKNLKTR